MRISFQKYFLYISNEDIVHTSNQQTKSKAQKLNKQYQHKLITILMVRNYKVFNFAYYQQLVNK